ncbi:hypothetical protein I302_108976 [Kwoniella bestiolae CBS 10118]|uniref:Rho termination factor-like N-terminal domain-containing protein n=1 Tax=Kwoniella bestiolae CBS 10118 TaxID=1296100 RepID=A0AAJ8MD05_9TREE
MHSQESLKKLKVSDLKAICKQLKAPNYSKLTKTALIQLILENQSSSANLIDIDPPPLTSQTVALQELDPPSSTPVNPSGTSQKSVNRKRKIDPLPQPTNPKTYFTDEDQPREDLKILKVDSTHPNLSVKPSTSHRRILNGKTHNDVASTSSSKAWLAMSKPRLIAKFQPLKHVQTTPKIVSPGDTTKHHNRGAITNQNLTTTSDRLQFIRKHFLEDLLSNLNAGRNIPIKTPPFPSMIPHSPSFDETIRDLAFQGIGPHVYSRQVSKEAFVVSVRFWLSRLHTLMQLGSGESWSIYGNGMGFLGPDLAKWPPVIGCSQISPSFWLIEIGQSEKIATSESSAPSKFITLGVNGDVLSSDLDRFDGETLHDCHVRKDWYTYILSEQNSDRTTLGLLSHVKTKNPSSYPTGLSRAWKEKIEAQGGADELIRIGERAVLASCALNSFSGSKLSANEMESHTLGYQAIPRLYGTSVVELYLPEHNGITDYVIAETGQVVGNEDGGVSELWQGLLGCDANGNEDRSNMKAFWNGWERRMME